MFFVLIAFAVLYAIIAQALISGATFGALIGLFFVCPL